MNMIGFPIISALYDMIGQARYAHPYTAWHSSSFALHG